MTTGPCVCERFFVKGQSSAPQPLTGFQPPASLAEASRHLVACGDMRRAEGWILSSEQRNRFGPTYRRYTRGEGEAREVLTLTMEPCPIAD
jgi:hypothetical protein